MSKKVFEVRATERIVYSFFVEAESEDKATEIIDLGNDEAIRRWDEHVESSYDFEIVQVQEVDPSYAFTSIIKEKK